MIAKRRSSIPVRCNVRHIQWTLRSAWSTERVPPYAQHGTYFAFAISLTCQFSMTVMDGFRSINGAPPQRRDVLWVPLPRRVPRADFHLLKAILTNCARHGPASQNRGGVPDFRG